MKMGRRTLGGEEVVRDVCAGIGPGDDKFASGFVRSCREGSGDGAAGVSAVFSAARVGGA